MRIINDYYLIEPNDSLDQIKYLIDLGCKVLGYIIRDNWSWPHYRRLIYSRFGDKISNITFCKLPDNLDMEYTNYYINYDV